MLIDLYIQEVNRYESINYSILTTLIFIEDL